VVVVEGELSLEQAIVHRPVGALPAGGFSRLRRMLCLRMDPGKWEISEHEP